MELLAKQFFKLLTEEDNSTTANLLARYQATDGGDPQYRPSAGIRAVFANQSVCTDDNIDFRRR